MVLGTGDLGTVPVVLHPSSDCRSIEFRGSGRLSVCHTTTVRRPPSTSRCAHGPVLDSCSGDRAVLSSTGRKGRRSGKLNKPSPTLFPRTSTNICWPILLAAELGGGRRLVTVLFSDLRGFTSMSENRQPEEIVEQLNQYFSAMVTIVFDHHGTIDKFVGDMIMALFNTPLPDEDHADHAVQCAIAMHRKLLEMNQTLGGVGISTTAPGNWHKQAERWWPESWELKPFGVTPSSGQRQSGCPTRVTLQRVQSGHHYQ